MAVQSAAERRLVFRVLGYWQQLRGLRLFARLRDVEPADLGADWQHCGLLQAEVHGHFRFVKLGSELEPPGRSLAGCTEAEVTAESLALYALENVSYTLAKRVPVSLGGERDLATGRMLYRSIVLPLSDDGERIDALMIAVNSRRVEQSAEPVQAPREGALP